MSTNKHIEEVIDNWATWLADADNKQDGFITDHTNSMALRDGTNYHQWQPNRYWNGAAWVYYDVTYDDITANGILYAAEYIHHLGDTGANTYLRFEEDKITLACGGVDMIEMVEDTADYVKINTNLGIGTVPSFLVHIQDVTQHTVPGAATALMIGGNSGGTSVGDCLALSFKTWNGFTHAHASIGVITTNSYSSEQADLYFATKAGTGDTNPVVRVTIPAAGGLNVQQLAEDTSLGLYTYSDTVTHAPYLKFYKSHQDTVGNTKTIDTDVIGALQWYGVDSGGNPDLGASIVVTQVGAAVTKVPCKMGFSTSTDSATNVAMTIDAAQRVGIGIGTPDTLVHIWSATAGTVAAATDALLCIENSGDAFISLLGGTANDVGIIAGDSGDNDIGSIKYSHAANTWTIVAGAANILTIASIYAKFNVDVFLPDSIYLKFGDTIADPRAYLFAETIVGPGDTLHINSDSMILLESGAGVIVTIQSSSVTFGGPADVDVLFYKGTATPAFTFDHGLGQFHAEDNCPSSWGNTAAAPDGKIYSDGTNLRVNGLPPSSGTNVNDWYVDNMGYVRVKLS